jgi:pimeloyl-ACP methyl ester carboxylesterase
MQPLFAELDIDGRVQRLEYAWVGDSRAEAPLVVFLHEGLGSLAMWKGFPQALCVATGTRGLVYSRSGYGRSTPRPAAEKWPVEYLHIHGHRVLPALLARLGIEDPPWLLGHSDGGSIALLYAAEFPDRVAGLVAVAPHVFVEDVSVTSIEQTRVAYGATKLRAKLARYHNDPDSAFFGWNDIWLDPAFRGWNIEDCLPQIRCQVLAVRGEDDEYGTMAQIGAIGRWVLHARLLALPDCGHSPHRDQPQALIDAVAAFMREHMPARLAVATKV